MVGYSIAWTAPIIPKLQDPLQTPLPVAISLVDASWIGSSFVIGVIMGPNVIAYLSNIIGRKKTLILSGVLTTIGYIFISPAKSYYIIIIGRFISGLGLGSVAVIGLVYGGEIASPSIRGIILTLTGVFHTLGILIVYSIGPFLSYSMVSYLLLVVSFTYILACVIYLPESPTFYILKGKDEDAFESLARLGRDKDALKEIESLKINFANNKSDNWKWKELLTNKTNRRSFIITLSLYIVQECCGIISVASYATTIFQKAGSSVDPSIATIIIGVTQSVTALIAPIFIEKMGRKTLLLISTAGCGICMATFGVYLYLDFRDRSLVSTIGWFPLLLLMLSYCSYSVGLSTVPNTLLGEMYCSNMRSIGTSVSMTLGWSCGFFFLTSFGYIVEAFGTHIMFWIFAVVNVIGFVIVVSLVPETKGMTLREIEQMLSR